MKQTIEDFENNARPEWNKEANWANIEKSINEPKQIRKTPLLLFLLGLSIFGTGYALSYYMHQGNHRPSTPADTKILHDTIQVIAQVRDTVIQYKKEFLYLRDTIFIEQEIAVNLVPELSEKNENFEIVEMPELYIPISETQYKLPDFKSTRTGKRISKPYATNVFFDDTTNVTRSEFRIFHRIEGRGLGYGYESKLVLIR